jgi:hypothetical protein
MENPMAEDNRNFWSMFEEAKQEVREWPEWKKEIQVGIYSEAPEAICPSPDNQPPKSPKK